jgi:hypothetical protein
MEIFLTVLIIQGIIFGGFCAFIASQKNRGSGSWFFLGFFFSILAVLALIAIPKENSADQPDTTRKCPFCAEFIKAEAVICRFCQNDLPVLEPSTPSQNDLPVLEPNTPSQVARFLSNVAQSIGKANIKNKENELLDRENRIIARLQKELNRDPTEKEIQKAKWDGLES